MVPSQNIGDTELGQWAFRLAITAVTFFLGWGLKDLKKRYDQVPTLEKTLAVLQETVNELDKRLSRLER